MKKLLTSLLLVLPLWAQAKTPAPQTVENVIQVYSQIASFKTPAVFTKGLKNKQQSDGAFIFEQVPEGQTLDQWSEMITLTGYENAIKNKKANNGNLISSIGTGFKNACPTTFNFKLMGEVGNAVAYVFSCGDVGSHSETTLVYAVNGVNDLYSFQWSERGASSSKPLSIDEAKWTARFQQLIPTLLPVRQ